MEGLPVRAMLYGGRRRPFLAPRANAAPNATHTAPTTVKPIYKAQSEPVRKKLKKNYIYDI